MHLGWKKDGEDLRDYAFVPQIAPADLPPHVDLSALSYEPPIDDQIPLNSCSAHALSALLQIVRAKEGLAALRPSRLFLYYNARELAGDAGKDDGATIRNGIKTVVNTGVCEEELWPYLKEKVFERPPQACYDAAQAHHAITYYRIDAGLDALKSCLAEGYPFVFGMSVFANFMGADAKTTGIVGMPAGTDPILGGHAVAAVGYDSSAKTFRVRNSLGTAWGQSGYFTLPEAFMDSRHCTDDFWTIRKTG